MAHRRVRVITLSDIIMPLTLIRRVITTDSSDDCRQPVVHHPGVAEFKENICERNTRTLNFPSATTPRSSSFICACHA